MNTYTLVQNSTDVPGSLDYAVCELTYVLIAVALGVVAVSVAALLHRRLAGAHPDLGWVSERWLAEYRADASRPSR